MGFNDHVLWTGVATSMPATMIHASKHDITGISVTSDRRGDDLGPGVNRRWYAYGDVRDRRSRKSDVDIVGTGRRARGKLNKRLCVRRSPFANNCCNVLLCSARINVVPGDRNL